MKKAEKQRKNWRKCNLKLVYFGRSQEDMQDAGMRFWISATSDQKHEAMRQFVADELERQGLTKYGSELLRFTSVFRTP